MGATQATTILSRRFPAKRAFVTGAASGLGRAIATELAGAGWRLGILDVSAGRLGEVERALRDAGATTRPRPRARSLRPPPGATCTSCGPASTGWRGD